VKSRADATIPSRFRVPFQNMRLQFCAAHSGRPKWNSVPSCAGLVTRQLWSRDTGGV